MPQSLDQRYYFSNWHYWRAAALVMFIRQLKTGCSRAHGQTHSCKGLQFSSRHCLTSPLLTVLLLAPPRWHITGCWCVCDGEAPRQWTAELHLYFLKHVCLLGGPHIEKRLGLRQPVEEESLFHLLTSNCTWQPLMLASVQQQQA